MKSFYKTAKADLPRQDMHVHGKILRTVTLPVADAWKSKPSLSHQGIIEHYPGRWLKSLGSLLNEPIPELGHLSLLWTRCIGMKDRTMGRQF